MEEGKKVLYSAAQPTNTLTIGNYIGAIGNWVKLQDEYNCFFAIANMHALTVRQVPAELRRRTLSLLALYIACGVDPEKCVLYLQSHVSAHAELCWVLNNYTYVGEMERMTQFKDKSAKHADNINMGLMDYPVLMAADILLYNSDYIPVGLDQRQHVEIARDIAQRFNNAYSPTFTVPEGIYLKVGAKINDLLDPTKKMSKSAENPNGVIFLDDDKDTIIRKFKRAVTDSNSLRNSHASDRSLMRKTKRTFHRFRGDESYTVLHWKIGNTAFSWKDGTIGHKRCQLFFPENIPKGFLVFG